MVVLLGSIMVYSSRCGASMETTLPYVELAVGSALP